MISTENFWTMSSDSWKGNPFSQEIDEEPEEYAEIELEEGEEDDGNLLKEGEEKPVIKEQAEQKEEVKVGTNRHWY